jgi:hypothetical protein
MDKTFCELKNKWAEFEHFAQKRVNGNKSAGVNSRKISLEMAKLFKQWRQESVQEVKNG